MHEMNDFDAGIYGSKVYVRGRNMQVYMDVSWHIATQTLGGRAGYSQKNKYTYIYIYVDTYTECVCVCAWCYVKLMCTLGLHAPSVF